MQCCCGCSLEFGVGSALFLHFAVNVMLVLMSVAHIIFGDAGLSFSDSLGLEALATAWALAGFVFIISAFWGLWWRIEVYLRLYFYYMVVYFLIDMGFIGRDFIVSGPCENMPPIFTVYGSAFACSLARISDAAWIIVVTLIQAYLIFVVYSHCEYLALEGGSELADLAEQRQWRFRMPTLSFRLPLMLIDPRTILNAIPNLNMIIKAPGLPSYKLVGDAYGSTYASRGPQYTWEAKQAGLASSKGIFGGQFHEVNYPPPH